MKTVLAGMTVIALGAVIGCEQGNPGGSGVTNRTANKPIVGQAEDTFTLDVPNLSTKVKQGETKDVAISIARGKNFDEDVALKFADVPKGVTIDPSATMIKHSEKQVKLTIQASKDAALGDFTIKVTGQPSTGPAATNEIKVTIVKP